MPKHGDRRMGICDVDRLVSNDSAIRETFYCSTCDAWICKRCEPNYPRRALAMAKKAKQKIFSK